MISLSRNARSVTISESELMQLKLSALQAKGKLTEAQSNLNAKMFRCVLFLGLSEEDG